MVNIRRLYVVTGVIEEVCYKQKERLQAVTTQK